MGVTVGDVDMEIIDAADILFSVWMCSYMAALEDTLNIGMCGLFLL